MPGLSNLKKLIELNISRCYDLQKLSVISLYSLEKLVLHQCCSLKIVSGISHLKKLVELVISGCPIFQRLRVVGHNNLKRIDVEYSFRPAGFEFDDCRNLETISGILNIEKVASINIRACPKLEMLPYIQGPGKLETVTIDGCEKLKNLNFSECENLKRVMGKLDISKLFVRFCPELEASSFLQGETCTETFNIGECGKLNGHKFPHCQNLKELCISDCWKLEDLTFSAHQTCLKYISIVRCEKLQNITLPTKHVGLGIEKCRNLKTEELNFDHRQCLELQEFSNVTRLSCLKWINIQSCAKLNTIQGTDELHELESITIYNCPELQELSFSSLQTCLEKITIVRCGKLQNIALPTKLVELEIIDCREIETVAAICNHSEYEKQTDFSSFAPLSCPKSTKSHTCDQLQTIQGNDGCGKITVDGCGNLIVEKCGKLKSLQLLRSQYLKQVCISDCGELDDLPCCASQTCLEKISIARCGKLQSITLPANLVDLRIEECSELKTLAEIWDHRECLELNADSSNVVRLSCLKRIIIQNCDKLQIIQGFDNLHALERMQLLYCCNEATRNCIFMLKTLPADLLLAVVGKAADGALSNLNTSLFSDIDSHISEIGSLRRHKMGESSAVIYCAIDGTSRHLRSNMRGRQGERIITGVTTNQYYGASYNFFIQSVEDVERRGIPKKGYAVVVDRSEVWKIRHVLFTIIDKLYEQPSSKITECS